jgi:hypothetical protein
MRRTLTEKNQAFICTVCWYQRRGRSLLLDVLGVYPTPEHSLFRRCITFCRYRGGGGGERRERRRKETGINFNFNNIITRHIYLLGTFIYWSYVLWVGDRERTL